ncbi:C-5 sterol desaturase [Angomonas deanei]|nr:C-5 sterol desaturase [Angomonas deanei]|eukprot:EPY39437.1 C-5 sterol desaturase [Angomonas deanei]
MGGILFLKLFPLVILKRVLFILLRRVSLWFTFLSTISKVYDNSSHFLFFSALSSIMSATGSFMDDLSPVAKGALQLVFVGIIYIGFAFYNSVVIPAVAAVVPGRIPLHVKPLEKFTTTDKVFIVAAKVVTALFVYHVYQFTVNTELSRMSVDFFDVAAVLTALKWFPLHLAILIMVYDFFYTLFHWALHWPPIYPLIHKHHHRQMAPFRGNSDAINDHPIEYISGEYLHLFALYVLTRLVPAGQVHAITAILFIFIGGTLASLNHTRVNFHIPYMFNVNSHDYHHRQPRVNFGQYVMFWDWVFGTYQAEGSLPADKRAALQKKAKEEAEKIQ